MRGPMYYTPIQVPAIVPYWLILCLWLAGAPFAAAAALWRRSNQRGRDERQADT